MMATGNGQASPPTGQRRPRVIVVGGGMAGCAAASCAAMAGGDVVLLERAEELTGSARRAGHIGTNGQFMVAEELKAAGERMLVALEGIIRHRDGVSLPGDEHTSIYDCGRVAAEIHRSLVAQGVEIRLSARVVGIDTEGDRLRAVELDDGGRIEGDVFIDATGSSGGVDVCEAHGMGCVECLFRCPEFGDRVSVAALAGVAERSKRRNGDEIGSIGAGVSLHKDSVDPDLKERLERCGRVTIPLPDDLVDEGKAAQQEAGRTADQMRYLNLSDIGPAVKCVGLSYLPLEQLRTVEGLSRARYEYPSRADLFNRIVMVAVAPWEEDLRVTGPANLFCAGEKTGVHGVVAVILTGALAGHNAVREWAGLPSLVLPTDIAAGAYLAYVARWIAGPDGLSHKFSLSNSPAVTALKDAGLYTFDVPAIQGRVEAAGLAGVLTKPVL